MIIVRPITPAPTSVTVSVFLGAVYFAKTPATAEVRMAVILSLIHIYLTGPIEDGIAPACRALCAPIELATGKSAYFVGKPNPLMMRTGLKLLGCHSNEAVMIGDRMDTDIVAGMETGLDTVLVLSGVSAMATIDQFPYCPTYVMDGVGNIPPACR